jgi:hypothetical protein
MWFSGIIIGKLVPLARAMGAIGCGQEAPFWGEEDYLPQQSPNPSLAEMEATPSIGWLVTSCTPVL